MFSLKINLLIPSLELAKAVARKLNAPWRREPPPDPREAQRIQDELRLAREQARAQVTRGRLLW